MEKTVVKIKGMHCDSCKEVIEEVCREFPGVQRCEVRVEKGVAAIEHDTPLDRVELVHEIESLGIYKVLDVHAENREDEVQAH